MSEIKESSNFIVFNQFFSAEMFPVKIEEWESNFINLLEEQKCRS